MARKYTPPKQLAFDEINHPGKKRCSKCNQWLTLDHYDRNKQGHQYYCKACKFIYERSKKNGISNMEWIRNQKRCGKCLQYKPAGEFYESRATDDKLFPNCKACCHTRSVKQNPETAKKRSHYESYFHNPGYEASAMGNYL